MYVSKQNCKLTAALHRTLKWRTTHNLTACCVCCLCNVYYTVQCLKRNLRCSVKKKQKRKTPGLGTFLKFLLFCFRKNFGRGTLREVNHTEWLTSRRVRRPKLFTSIYLYLYRMIELTWSSSAKFLYKYIFTITQNDWHRKEFLTQIFLLIYIHINTEWLSLRGILRPTFFTSNEYQYTGRKKLFAQKFLSV